jgi:hypothetical protein
MQFLLSGYAAWWNARHGYSGHVFQGRFRGHLVEDERYFWAVSRYAHLNPTPVLVEHPLLWKWSTYAGYVDPSRRVPWVAYDTLLDAWQGEFGGLTPSQSYQQFVESGIREPIASPFDQAIDGWILGSESFAERIRASLSPAYRRPSGKKERRKVPLTKAAVSDAICSVLDVTPQELSARGSRHPARALFAYLCRCFTDATLSEVAERLGLTRADCVPAQVRRVVNSAPESELRRQLGLLENALGIGSSSFGSDRF